MATAECVLYELPVRFARDPDAGASFPVESVSYVNRAPRCFGLVPAAGVGTRVGGGMPKQYTPLGGVTMLEHAVDALRSDPRVDGVVVVVSAQDRLIGPIAGRLGVQIAAVGGASRALSVANGLAQLAADAADEDFVLVHDAARPCLARDELTLLIDTLLPDPVGGLLALPMADTVKRANGERVCATVDRHALWRALTPQMFRVGTLRRALSEAGDASFATHTDESSAIERLGLAPRLVAGRTTNIKVTTREDLPLALAILQAQGRVDRAVNPAARGAPQGAIEPATPGEPR
jgi:2-C-methyl-D-erythritol 4-phosphate cytidylyltransferase